jgi:UDPglucose 6-dehydrogenase
MKYSVIGLGKLGASMAAGIASRGYEVIGVDVLEENVNSINQGNAPVQETNLQEVIQNNSSRIRATLEYTDAIINTDISFVIVPTPSEPNGRFSLKYAKEAFIEIGKALKNKNKYHLVVLTSTVLPGSMRYGLIPLLEKHSGKSCGIDFGACYSPEFIALGSIIYNFLNPDFNLVGEYDKKSGDLLEEAYMDIMVNNPPCKRMSIENAELTKVALNTFITSKITFANMLADITSHIPGGDIDAITDALGSDSRVGHKYLKGGLGYGGPCFPRDNIALTSMSEYIGSSAEMAKTTDKVNDDLTEKIGKDICSAVTGGVVGILGLAYKPDTHVIEESQSIILAKYLKKCGFTVIGYDPLANDCVEKEAGDIITVVNTLKECIKKSDVVVIATPDKEFAELNVSDLKNKIVYDCWRLLRSKLQKSSSLTYMALGVERNDYRIALKLSDLWGG